MKTMIRSNHVSICILVALLALTAAPARADLIDQYPSPERMYAEITELAEAHAGHVELIEYGKSVQGRPLLALRFHRGDGVERPGAMVAGNIHGEEWIGNRTAMAIAQRVARDFDNDPWLEEFLSKMDLYVLPCVNPDGYQRTFDSHGRDKLGDMRKNANGVDLNRNFPPPGKKKPKQGKVESTGYPGPAAFSEPETKALADLALERNVIAAIGYHSVVGEVITPACGTWSCARRYWAMSLAYSRGQKHRLYFIVIPPPVGETPGMMEPYLYHRHGIMAILVELGLQPVNVIQNRSIKTFEVFNPKNPDFWADNEVEAALSALSTAYDLMGGERTPVHDR